MSIQDFKISRTYPVFQYENWIDQTTDLIQTIPQFTNVKYWGAKGNGTTDDTQSFINALASGLVCTLLVPPGTYLLTSTISIPSGKAIQGTCKNGSQLNFVNNTAGFIAVKLNINCGIYHLRLLNGGTNRVDSVGIEVGHQNSLIENVQMGVITVQWGIGIKYGNGVPDPINGKGNHDVVSSRIHGEVSAVIFDPTDVLTRFQFVNNLFSAAPITGTVINLTGAGLSILFCGNIITSPTSTNTLLGINVAVPAAIIGNLFSLMATDMSGAALATSTLMNNSTTTALVKANQNILVPLNIAGNQVVKSRIGGWATATGVATRTTFDTATVTLPQLAERVKALLDDIFSSTATSLTSHGLIGP
jgi:hypothetical protein